jgi:hypothetical protein
MPTDDEAMRQQLGAAAERQLVAAGMPAEQARVVAALVAAAGATWFAAELRATEHRMRRIMLTVLLLATIDAVGTVAAVVLMLMR